MWRVREGREAGKEAREWELNRSGLTVGRSHDAQIQLLSQTVESEHAVFEWDARAETYSIRDLGSVNGTFLNGTPLWGCSAVLEHGAAVRFGYEKSRVFRVEVFNSPQPSPPPPSPSHGLAMSTVSAQTTASEEQASQSHSTPHQAPSTPHQAPTTPHQAPSTPHQAPPTPHQPTAVHYLPVLSLSPGALVTPSAPLTLTSPLPLQPYEWHAVLPRKTTPTSPWDATPTPSPAMPSSSSLVSREPVGEGRSPSTAVSRQDGRRAAGLVGSKGSPLYGQPQWWGEEEGEGEGEGRRGDVTRSSLASSLPGTGGEEGRGKRPEVDRGPPGGSAWMVELAGLQTHRRPRSADSSPSRTSRGGVACGGVARSPASAAQPSSEKPPSVPLATRWSRPAGGCQGNPRSLSGHKKKAASTARTIKSHSDTTLCADQKSTTGHGKKSRLGSAARSHSEDRLGRGGARVSVAKGNQPKETDRPSSARRQWNEENTLPLDSLMVASIRARMVRLSKLAHTTAEAVSSLTPSHPPPLPLPLPTSPSPALPAAAEGRDMPPDWKFFNKEVDGIFKSIGTVEASLRAIDGAVCLLRPSSARREVVEEEEVDGESSSGGEGEGEGEGESLSEGEEEDGVSLSEGEEVDGASWSGGQEEVVDGASSSGEEEKASSREDEHDFPDSIDVVTDSSNHPQSDGGQTSNDKS